MTDLLVMIPSHAMIRESDGDDETKGDGRIATSVESFMMANESSEDVA